MLLAAAGWLALSAYTAYWLDSRDLDFILKSPLASLSAETWLYRGNYKFQNDNDPAAAAEYYRRAVWMEPSFIDTWMGLARAELAQGNKDETRRILKIISPSIAELSTWKTEELQFAFELRDEQAFDASLNYILTRLPDDTQEASQLAADFWGGWETRPPMSRARAGKYFWMSLCGSNNRMPHSSCGKRCCRKAQLPKRTCGSECANFCWAASGLRMQKQFGVNGKVKAASGSTIEVLIYEPLNTAFGWRLERNADFLIERAPEGQCKGRRCLHLRFSGKKNMALDQTLQVIPVEPGRAYRLRFAGKAANLTTEKGVFIDVVGYGCEGLHVQGVPVTGTTGWIEEQLDFLVPKECEAITLGIRRDESLKLDCKISGDYWLDAVEMETLSDEL